MTPTVMKINSPNYKKAQQTAYTLVEEYALLPNFIFPISLRKIIENISNIQLETYSQLAFLTNNPFDVISKELKSDEGTTIFDAINNRYVIAYNEKRSEHRIRFTIAHELGHIYLGHLLNDVPEKLYKTQETEANYFAKRLLVPQPLICKALQITNLKSLNRNDISFIFDVSLDVATYSIQNYNNLSFIPEDETMCKPFVSQISQKISILQMEYQISQSA